MINKYLKEYVETQNNKQQNYNAIISKVKGGNTMNVFKRNIFRVAIPVLAVMMIVIVVPKIQAYFEFQAEFKEFQSMPKLYGNGEKIDDEAIEMDYIEKDGIKAKVDSVVASEDEIRVGISFEIPEEYEVNSETFRFSYVIYDSNKNVFAVYNRRHNIKRNNLPEIVFKELGLDYDRNNIWNKILTDSDEGGVIKADGRTLTYEIIINSCKGYPKTKKLYIKAFDLGYFFPNKEKNILEDYDITNTSWEFEIDIPDKYYYSNSINLKLEKSIDGLSIKKAKLSDTNLSFVLNDNYIMKVLTDDSTETDENWNTIINQLIYVTDEENNRYELEELGTAGGDDISYRVRVTKEIFEKTKLYLNVIRDGKIYTSQLVKE